MCFRSQRHLFTRCACVDQDENDGEEEVEDGEEEVEDGEEDVEDGDEEDPLADPFDAALVEGQEMVDKMSNEEVNEKIERLEEEKDKKSARLAKMMKTTQPGHVEGKDGHATLDKKTHVYSLRYTDTNGQETWMEALVSGTQHVGQAITGVKEFDEMNLAKLKKRLRANKMTPQQREAEIEAWRRRVYCRSLLGIFCPIFFLFYFHVRKRIVLSCEAPHIFCASNCSSALADVH